jgi:hypothetical protein
LRRQQLVESIEESSESSLIAGNAPDG